MYMSKEPTSKALSRCSLFGPPLLVEGEDAAAYDELLGRVCAAVQPVDVIDEMFVADVVSLEWEVLRWRRLKSSLIRERVLKALVGFLDKQLDYDANQIHFADRLRKMPQDDVTDGGTDDVARRLAKELAQEYERREPATVKVVNELLAAAGTNIDFLMVNALLVGQEFDYIERLDRLSTIAETCRNASLREIDRRRAVIGERLRRSLQEVEDAEYQVVETAPAKGENAA
jgi:hypothetical protein